MGRLSCGGASPSLSRCVCSRTTRTDAVRLLSRPRREILNGIAKGKSNSTIATIMGLNERAIRYHVSQTLQKLGVATRAQAVAIFGSGKLP